MITQLPPHAVVGAGQLDSHLPPAHSALGHATPQLPQFVELVPTSTQAPAQSVVAGGHLHVPAVHCRPPVHTTPHAPQFSGSFWTLIHAPAQADCPEGHSSTHLPLLQKVAGAHAASQAPQ